MGWITTRLGYGLWGTVDGDIDGPPQVTVVGTIQANSQLIATFGRMMNQQFNDNEEVRFDTPANFVLSFEYSGVAPAGSSTSDPVWSCIRCTWINNHKSRYQFMADVSWDARASLLWS